MNPNNTELYKFYKDQLHVGQTDKFRPNDEDVTYTIRENIVIPNETKILKAKSKIFSIVKSFLAKNGSKLGLRYPTNRIPFLKSDMDILFTACGIKRQDLYEACISIKANDIDTKNHLIQEPFNMLCTIVGHVFLRNDKNLMNAIMSIAKGKIPDDKYKYSTVTYQIILYLTLHFYSALFIKYWKFDPVEAVMDYTIENMSNKYIIRKCQNILEFICYHSETNIENMIDRLYRGSDVDLIYFFSNLNNRLSHAMRTIANAYYENKENKNYVSTDSASRTNDEGKFYVGDTASVSADIINTVNRIVSRFFSEDVIDDRLVGPACAKTKFSKAKFIIILQRIKENHQNDVVIKNIFTAIISYYITTLNGEIDNIKSNKFLVDMFRVYSISNTNNDFLNVLKNQLSKLVKLNAKAIIDESNGSLVDRCKTSLYNFFILYIAANSK